MDQLVLLVLKTVDRCVRSVFVDQLVLLVLKTVDHCVRSVVGARVVFPSLAQNRVRLARGKALCSFSVAWGYCVPDLVLWAGVKVVAEMILQCALTLHSFPVFVVQDHLVVFDPL